jgi:GTPase SAR1 family protein
MFDMARVQTLIEIAKWAQLIRSKSKNGIPIVLIGEDLDLVPPEDLESLNDYADKIAQENGFMAYIPTSSRTGFNVNESILYMVDNLISLNS